MSEPYGIHWFRRDLRVNGNPALRKNFKENHGRVLGLFTIDRKFLGRDDFSHNRFQFFIDTLKALKQDLLALGGDLLVLDDGPDQAFERIVQICGSRGIHLPRTISWNRDYEPFARVRDERVSKLIEGWGISTIMSRDHLLIEPGELLKSDGSFYQVYTPFARRWFELSQTAEVRSRVEEQSLQKPASTARFRVRWRDLLGENFAQDELEALDRENKRHVTVHIPPAGFNEALRQATNWQVRLNQYGKMRDIPSENGTSRLSVYLKNGSFTTSQIVALYKLNGADFKSDLGATKYLKELVWREFYYHLLWHVPRVESEAFQGKYKNLTWDNDQSLFEAWKLGKTGFPIVDAGMRELLTTGWMHNRVRMIVASFLTKDLLVDWRWGEKWFMERLLDGDLAPNNGGWQWAASTGCDAQPYFRIFNPESQSLKFDPEGVYIKTFLPELSRLSKSEIHNPPLEVRKKLGYPRPIVNHGERRIAALLRYKV